MTLAGCHNSHYYAATESVVPKAPAAVAPRDIPCRVIADEADAAEISLVENVQREAMHPADEFDALRALIEGRMPPADVAAGFGVPKPW